MKKQLIRDFPVAKRDLQKTALNKQIAEMKQQLRLLLPDVLSETGIKTEASLNALIGGKAAEYIDLHHEQIHSADAYASLYMRGFKAAMSVVGKYPNSHRERFEIFRGSTAARKYFLLFLRRMYLNHREELERVRPHLDESEIWIGQN